MLKVICYLINMLSYQTDRYLWRSCRTEGDERVKNFKGLRSNCKTYVSKYSFNSFRHLHRETRFIVATELANWIRSVPRTIAQFTYDCHFLEERFYGWLWNLIFNYCKLKHIFLYIKFIFKQNSLQIYKYK